MLENPVLESTCEHCQGESENHGETFGEVTEHTKFAREIGIKSCVGGYDVVGSPGSGDELITSEQESRLQVACGNTGAIWEGDLCFLSVRKKGVLRKRGLDRQGTNWARVQEQCSEHGLHTDG